MCVEIPEYESVLSCVDGTWSVTGIDGCFIWICNVSGFDGVVEFLHCWDEIWFDFCVWVMPVCICWGYGLG
jgi:hypothetical protein